MLNGSCYCGAITFSVSGTPKLSAYCHCTNCQRLSGEPSEFSSNSPGAELITIHPGCPFVHTAHFDQSQFAWTHPEPHGDRIDPYPIEGKEWKTRWRCKRCGGCVVSMNSKTNGCSVWGAVLERDAGGKIKHWDTVKPTAHIFYETRMLDIEDDLGKWVGYEGKSARLE